MSHSSDKGAVRYLPALISFLILGSAAAQDATSAELSAQTSFDIAAQPLSTALKQLADQAGIQILFEERVVQGHDAPALLLTSTGATRADPRSRARPRCRSSVDGRCSPRHGRRA